MTQKEIRKILEFKLNNWLFDVARAKTEYGYFSRVTDMYIDECMGLVHAMYALNVISLDEFDGLNRSIHGNCNYVIEV